MAEVDFAIIGGGIAGLSAALAYHRAGINTHLFEAAPEFTTLGTSLSLWPNALACLDDWGMADHLIAKGAVIDRVAIRRPNGRIMTSQLMQHAYADAGHPGICIRRSDVVATLLADIPDDIVHTGHRLTAIEQAGSGQTLTFDNGTRISAKHVIAADGIWSPTRAMLQTETPPKYGGYGAWLGLSSGGGFDPGEGCEYLGADGRMGVFETGRDTRYWFYVSRADTPPPPTPVPPVSAKCTQCWGTGRRSFMTWLAHRTRAVL